MKKTVSAILLAALILGLTSGLSLGASALRTHLDSLQINVPAIYQSADLKGEGNITINSGDRIYIIGWVAFSSSDGLKEIKYGINGVEYACEDNYRDRTDLSANGIVSYNNGAHAGFGKDDGMMELTGIDKLAPGSYTVTLKAYSYGGASSEFKTFRLTVKGGDVMQLDALQVNSATLGASENLKGRGRVTIYSGDRLYVAGWAAFFGGAKLEKIVYECGGKTYECEDNYRDRPDVQSIGVYPADGGAHAGYGSDEAMLELSGIGSLPFGVYSVSVKAVADNGRAAEITSFILRVMSKGGSGCDVNADGAVNNKDVVTLFRYVSGGDVTVDGSAADCNGDGSVDNKDVAYLFRYVSGGETSGPASDTYEGSAPYTENGDVIVVDGVSYPNTANMKNGVTVATDDLGRETVMNGGYVSDGTKNVGLFYFLWMGEHGDSGILDISGMAGKPGYARITIEKPRLNENIDLRAEVMNVLADNGINAVHTLAGIDSMNIFVKQSELEGHARAVTDQIKKGTGATSVKIEKGLALIAVITAAIAAIWQEEGHHDSGFVVRRVRRVQNGSARARAAREEQIYSHF